MSARSLLGLLSKVIALHLHIALSRSTSWLNAEAQAEPSTHLVSIVTSPPLPFSVHSYSGTSFCTLSPSINILFAISKQGMALALDDGRTVEDTMVSW